MTKILPKKHLGQNFLKDRTVLNQIIRAADVKKTDIILEIGPGLGVLTKELAKRAKKVITIEKDKNLMEILEKEFEGFNNIQLINSDALKYEPRLKNYKIIANLPYYIASPIIRKFLEVKNPPKEMILMVQKEVGQRICAKPPNMSILTISVLFYAEPKIISLVPKTSFWPQPKVDSAIIRITPASGRKKERVNADLFFKIAKAGFSSPRKQILNNLSKILKTNKEKVGLWLASNKISPTQRPESLMLKDWVNLAKTHKQYV